MYETAPHHTQGSVCCHERVCSMFYGLTRGQRFKSIQVFLALSHNTCAYATCCFRFNSGPVPKSFQKTAANISTDVAPSTCASVHVLMKSISSEQRRNCTIPKRIFYKNKAYIRTMSQFNSHRFLIRPADPTGDLRIPAVYRFPGTQVRRIDTM